MDPHLGVTKNKTKISQTDTLSWDGTTMLTRFLGPRYHWLTRDRVPPASTRGAMGSVGLVGAADWRLILDYVPYVNGKFKRDD